MDIKKNKPTALMLRTSEEVDLLERAIEALVEKQGARNVLLTDLKKRLGLAKSYFNRVEGLDRVRAAVEQRARQQRENG